MSLSTTCSLFWADVNDNVVEVDHDSAVCDSSYTSCTITGSHGGTLQATCNSEQQYPDTTSGYYTSYFCACNGNSVSVPSGVTCSPACYDLSTSFPTCSLVWVYDAFTSGDPGTGITQDTCEAFMCDSNGVECTDSSATLLYQCDNEEHQSQVASDSTHSYICNCQGPAQIPDLYRGTSGESAGSACGGGSASSGGDSASGGGSSASDGGDSTTEIQQAGAESATATATSAPIDASSVPGTTTSDLPATSTIDSLPSSTSSDDTGSQGSGSTTSAYSKCMVLSLCLSVLSRLL